MTYITRIANKIILAKYFLHSLPINYLHWKLSASRSIFSCYATYSGPYYYDSAYILLDDSNKINKAIPVDANGKCHIAALVMAKSDDDNEH